MMIVPDIDSLSIEAKFFSRLKDLEQLRNSISNVIEEEGFLWWIPVASRERYLEFTKNLAHIFKDNKGMIKAKSDDDKFFAALRLAKPSAPYRIRILLNEKENGTIISVLCWPVMYPQVTQLPECKGKKFPVTDIKSAILECQEFMLNIFSGPPGHEILDSPHPRKPVELKSYEFLKNTKEERELSEKIKPALQNAKKEVHICGWIGQAIVPVLRTLISRGVAVKIITKTPSAETAGKGFKDKTTAFEQLKDLNKKNIRLAPTCHNRILIIDDDNVFVGSMDMDSESFDQREECAIWSNDPSLVIRAKVCFENLFKTGKQLG